MHGLQHIGLEEGIAYEGCNKGQLIAKLGDQAEYGGRRFHMQLQPKSLNTYILKTDQGTAPVA